MKHLPEWLTVAALFADGELLTPEVQAALASSPQWARVILARADASYATLKRVAPGVHREAFSGSQLTPLDLGVYRTPEQEAKLLAVYSRFTYSQRYFIRNLCEIPGREGLQSEAYKLLAEMKLTKAQRLNLIGDASSVQFRLCPELTDWYLELKPHIWLGSFAVCATPVKYVSDERFLRILNDIEKALKPDAVVSKLAAKVAGYSPVLHKYRNALPVHLEPRPAVAAHLAQYPAWLPVIAQTSHWKDEYVEKLELWKDPAVGRLTRQFNWYTMVSLLISNPAVSRETISHLIDTYPDDGEVYPDGHSAPDNLRSRLNATQEHLFKHWYIMHSLSGSRKALELYLNTDRHGAATMVGSPAGDAAEAAFPGIMDAILHGAPDEPQDLRAAIETYMPATRKHDLEVLHGLLTAVPESKRAEALILLSDLIGAARSASAPEAIQAVETVAALVGP